jgi:hypothetical protein
MTSGHEATVSLALRLQAVRQELYGDRGIPELAEAVGVPARTWANYEAGVVVPGTTLVRFLAITRTRPEWLLTGKGTRYLGASMPGGYRVAGKAWLN